MNFDSDLKNASTPQKIADYGTSSNSLPLTYQTADNLHTIVIRTTEDKLRNHLKDYKEISTYPSYALGAFGVLVTLIITLTTIDKFQAKWGMSSDSWYALYVFLTLLLAVLLIIFLYKWWKNKDLVDLEHLINKIKNQEKGS